MATFTPKLNLEKPLGTEFYNVTGVQNVNSDKIDSFAIDIDNSKFENVGIIIPDGANLNTYRTCGHYRCPADVSAGTIINAPFGASAFSMIVEGSNGNDQAYHTQTAINHGKTQTKIRATSDAGATWTAWIHVLTEAETVNNLISTSATLPLSANMGKKLVEEKFSNTGMALPMKCDMNTILKKGHYTAIGLSYLTSGTGFKNDPFGLSEAFTMVVDGLKDGVTDSTPADRYIVQTATSNTGKIKTRNTQDAGATWTAWIHVLTEAETVNNLISTSATLPLSAGQGKILQDTKANGTTQVIAGNGLTGGGNLTANRTLDIVSANAGIVVNADNIQLNTVDNLASTSATQPLSGNQGNVIKKRTDCMAGGEIKGYIEDGGSHLVGEVWLSKNTPGEFKCLIANSDNYPDLTPTAPKWLQIDDLANANKLENLNYFKESTVVFDSIQFSFSRIGKIAVLTIKTSKPATVLTSFTVAIPSNFISKILATTVASANNTGRSLEVIIGPNSSTINCTPSTANGNYLYGSLTYFLI